MIVRGLPFRQTLRRRRFARESSEPSEEHSSASRCCRVRIDCGAYRVGICLTEMSGLAQNFKISNHQLMSACGTGSRRHRLPQSATRDEFEISAGPSRGFLELETLSRVRITVHETSEGSLRTLSLETAAPIHWKAAYYSVARKSKGALPSGSCVVLEFSLERTEQHHWVLFCFGGS